jgi:hypothetical protein
LKPWNAVVLHGMAGVGCNIRAGSYNLFDLVVNGGSRDEPNRPEDVLKMDASEDGIRGDDPADALRYFVATKGRSISQRKLRGL